MIYEEDDNLMLLIEEIDKEKTEKEILTYFSDYVCKQMNETNLVKAWDKFKKKDGINL